MTHERWIGWVIRQRWSTPIERALKNLFALLITQISRRITEIFLIFHRISNLCNHLESLPAGRQGWNQRFLGFFQKSH